MAPSDLTRRPWFPYVAPMAAFLIFTSLEGSIGLHYPMAYTIKIALVSAVAWYCRSAWADLKPWPRPGVMLVSAAVGVLVIVAWVGLDGRYPGIPGLSGTRAEFDPLKLPDPHRLGFLGVRLFGLVLLVPLIEELFWRSFLIRWLIDDRNFQGVSIGKVTPMAAGITSILFALAHPEWLPALLTGLAWAGLLAWSRSVSACFLSHAVANMVLGIYVITNQAWKFW